MPMRQRLREFTKSFSSRLDTVFSSRSAAQSTISLPDTPVARTPFAHPEHPAAALSEINVPGSVHGYTTNRGQGSAIPLTLVLTQTTGEVSLVSQQSNTSDSGQMGGQPAARC